MQNRQKPEGEKTRKRGEFGARALVFLVAAGSSVGAVLCFRAGFSPGPLLPRIGWDVGGALLAVLSCFSWFIFLATLQTGKENFFLYDRKTKTSIPVEQLTWERVEERLIGCFSYYFRNGRRANAMPEVLRPLFLPFFLLQFKDGKKEDVDRLFTENKEMLDSAVLSLNTLHLEDEGRRLMYHFGSYRGDPEPFRSFILASETKIQGKMLDYIKEHIDEFI